MTFPQRLFMNLIGVPRKTKLVTDRVPRSRSQDKGVPPLRVMETPCPRGARETCVSTECLMTVFMLATEDEKVSDFLPLLGRNSLKEDHHGNKTFL